MALRQTGELARVTATVVTTDISARWTRNRTLGGPLASEMFAKNLTLSIEGCGARQADGKELNIRRAKAQRLHNGALAGPWGRAKTL